MSTRPRTYEVTIRAVLYKTMYITDALDEDDAVVLATERFTLACDSPSNEHYDQDVVSVEDVTTQDQP